MAQALDDDPVVVSDLTKTYGGGQQAVQGLSFRVGPGEVFGLLGPNGAGKTTTVGVLTTLVRSSSGSARVGGYDVEAEPRAVRNAIGVVFQDSVLDNDFSATQNLRLHARLWNVSEAGPKIAALLAAVGLTERADDVLWTYSGGMRRRLEIARALLGGPRVLFLDEPTLGLDPIARRDLWEVVRTLRERTGVTVLLTTHYLEEAQDVCDRVAIVNRGQIVETGSPQDLVAALGDHVAELTVEGDPGPLLAALRDSDVEVIETGATVAIVGRGGRQALADRLAALPLQELAVRTSTVRPATLNDVFLHRTTGDHGRRTLAEVGA